MNSKQMWKDRRVESTELPLENALGGGLHMLHYKSPCNELTFANHISAPSLSYHLAFYGLMSATIWFSKIQRHSYCSLSVWFCVKRAETCVLNLLFNGSGFH